MGAFASDVAQLPRIVTLNDVAITNDKGVLTLDAVAKTFRYLDEEEIAKQRKAAKDAKDKAARNEALAAPSRWARASLLAGCGGESHQDLRAWMAEQGKGARGQLDPLPQIKPYEPFAYNAFDLPDPFKPRKIEPTKGGSKLAPDLTRRTEPLEAYPLESLNMVGTLAQGQDDVRAGAHAGQGRLPGDAPGNYLGQNFGVIIGITDSEIRLKELVQDGAGDWTERTSTLQLIQADTKTQERRK